MVVVITKILMYTRAPVVFFPQSQTVSVPLLVSALTVVKLGVGTLSLSKILIYQTSPFLEVSDSFCPLDHLTCTK